MSESHPQEYYEAIAAAKVAADSQDAHRMIVSQKGDGAYVVSFWDVNGDAIATIEIDENGHANLK